MAPCAAHLETGKRIGEHVPLLDQPSKHRAKHRQRAGDGIGRQRAREQPPLRGRSRSRRCDPAGTRCGMTQEGTIGRRILAGEGRQRLAAFDNRPQQQPFRFPAIGALRFSGLVPFEPGADCLIVVIGLERAHRPRCTEGATGTIDFVRYADDFPRHHGFRRWHHDRCAGPLGERRISGKEGFDLSSTSYAKSWNREPPAPATGNSHGQLRERPDAVLVQCRDSAGR